MTNQFEQRYEQRLNAMPDGLQHWLRLATLDLGRVAKWRIADDIESHYTQAREEALASGHDEENAHLIAMDGLGDPRQARKEFRRKYLTREEERSLWTRWIHNRLSIVPKYLRYCIFAFILALNVGFAALLAIEPAVMQNGQFWRLAALYLAVLIVTVYQVKHKSPRVQVIVHQAALNAVLFLVFMALIMDLWQSALIYLIVGTYLIHRPIQLMRRVPHEYSPDEWEMLMSDCEQWAGERTAIRKWEAKHGRRIWE